MALSASELFLNIQTGIKSQDISNLGKLREQLEGLDVASETGIDSLRKLVSQVAILSKTPFLNKTSLQEAASLIDTIIVKMGELKAMGENDILGMRVGDLKEFKTAQKEIQSQLKTVTSQYVASEKLQENFNNNILRESEKALSQQTQLQEQKLQEQLKSRENYLNLTSKLRTEENTSQQKYFQQTQAGLLLESQYRDRNFIEKQKKAEDYNNLVSRLRKEEVDGQKAQADYLEKINRESREATSYQANLLKQQNEEKIKAQQNYSQLVSKLRKDEISSNEKAYKENFAATQRGLQMESDYRDRVAKERQAKEQNYQNLVASLRQREESSINTLNKAWDKFRLVFARVFDALLSFTIINWTQRIFTGFFTSLITSNQLIEETGARLQALVPDSNEIAKIWTKIAEVTITTPFKIDEVSKAAVLLKTFGVGVISNLKVIADWASAVKKDLGDTAIAFAKIVNYSPRIALLLSTRGLSLSAFDTYVKRFGDRTVALSELINDTFGGTAERISKTYAGMLSNISDLWTLISQKIGQPLFDTLKSDLSFVYDMMSKINKASSTWLTILGEIINVGANLLIFATVGAAISFIVIKFTVLVELARKFFLYQATPVLWSLIVTAIGLAVIETLKLVNAMDSVIDAQKELSKLSLDDHSKRIDEIDTIIQGLEQEKSAWFGISDAIVRFFDLVSGGIKSANAQLEIYKKIREDEKERLNDRARSVLLLNAEISGLDKYEIQQKVLTSGQKEFLKNQVAIVSARKKELEESLYFATQKGRGDIAAISPTEFVSISKLKDMIAFSGATEIYLKLITGQISKTEALKEVQDQLTNSFKNSRMEENGTAQAFERLKQTISEFIDDSDKINKGTDKNNHSVLAFIETLKKLNQELGGEKAKFEEFYKNQEIRNRPARIAKIDEILSKAGLKNLEDYKNYSDKIVVLSEEQLQKKIAEIELQKRITPEQEKQKYGLQIQLGFLKLINELLGLRRDEETALTNIKQQDLDKQLTLNNAFRDYNDSLIQAKLRMGDITPAQYLEELNKSFNKSRSELGDINVEIQSLSDKLSYLPQGTEEWYSTDIKLKDLELKRVGIAKDLLRTYEEIFNQPSQDFGRAWLKQLIKLQEETSKWRDELADTITQAGKGLISDIFKGALARPSDDEQQRMSDLQVQLEQIRAKKKGIYQQQSEISTIEDDELKTLQEINKLERERSDFLRTGVLKALQMIEDKLIDMVAQDLMSKIFDISGVGKKSKETSFFEDLFNIGTKVATVSGGAGGATPPTYSGGDIPIGPRTQIRGGVDLSERSRPITTTHNTSTSKVVNHNYIFKGDTYGYDDFKKKVTQIHKENSRTVV